MEAFAAVASAVIALLALGVSGWFARKQAKMSREQTRIAEEQIAIQRRLAAIEEARRADEVEARGRARVTATIRRANLAEPTLVLHNEGAALARSVDAEITSLDGDPLPMFDGIESLPVDLQPGQPIVFTIFRASGDANTVGVSLRWADEAGDHQESWTLQIGS
jgi:hypothetical protein